MKNKIRGVEQEIAINTLPPLPHRSISHLIGMAVEELRREGFVTGIRVEDENPDLMALNGFRVYNDMNHLELSSPSYNSPQEAVIYDKVAELFALYAVRSLRKYFKGLNAYKNNISTLPKENTESQTWRAVSYSTHSSILMSRKVINLDVWDNVEAALIPFMVTRIPLIGGGDLVPTPKKVGYPNPGKEIYGDMLRFAISPRAIFVKKLSSNDTVSARGLLNQRDDPHANPAKYWRFHDINWEGLRSPYQIYLRDSLETLVMLAYEKGYLTNPPRLSDPVAAVKSISLDPHNCKWKIPLKGGKQVYALFDIMEGFYLAGIEKMFDENDANEEDRMGFNLIEATLHVLGEGRLEYLIHGLDWITKMVLLEDYNPSNEREALGICNQYCLIDEAVLMFIGESADSNLIQTTFDLESSLEFVSDAIPLHDWDRLDEVIKHALRNGPEGNREYIRCLIAREFPYMTQRIEWERITMHNSVISLDEPLSFNKEICGDTLESATTNLVTFLHAINSLDKERELVVRTPLDDHELRER